MNNHIKENKFAKIAVKTMANIAKSVAKSGIKATSWMLINQPKEPKNLAKRLQKME